MSSMFAEIEAAIVAKIGPAVPAASLIADLNEAELAELAATSKGMVLNLILDEITFTPNEEFGGYVRQPERWKWRLELLLPTSKEGGAVAHDVFTAIRGTFTPTAWAPAADCGELNMERFENSGELGVCRVYTAFLFHDRDIG